MSNAKQTVQQPPEEKQEVIEINPPAQFAAKISKLIGAAKYVQKSGFNSFHKYKYATEADFLALVKPMLAEEKIAVLASTEQVTREEVEPTFKGRRQWLTTVKMNFKIIDGETGYSETLTAFGDGIDSEDKGLYKAITGCVKYFISKLFLIETGDDPERDDEHDAHEPAKKVASKPAAPAPVAANGQTFDEMTSEITKLMKLPCFNDDQRASSSQFVLEIHTNQEVSAKLAQIKAFIAKRSKAEAKNGKVQADLGISNAGHDETEAFQ